MRNIIRSLVIILITIVGHRPLISGELKGVINSDNYHFSNIINKNTKIDIQISKQSAIQLSPESLDALDSYEGWQIEKVLAHDNIAKLNVIINGVPIFYPHGSVLGVPYPDKFKIWNEGGQLYLQLSLGDGGFAYTLTFKMIPSKRKRGAYTVSDRTLRSGEFPSEVWEKTQYHNDRWDSDL